jgi:gamma-glutamyltranspeptidase/glutathione hydrolase
MRWNGRVVTGVMTAAALGLIMTMDLDAQEPQQPERDRTQARSVVTTRYGIVSAEQPLAAQAGVQILSAGGNAVDAAVATNAAMGLMSPTGNGIGGDLFALVYIAKDKKLYGLNASGWAPAGHTPAYYKSKNLGRMPERGVFAVTVPGAVAGWAALLDRFGSRKFPDVLAPAIRYAGEGFPVAELVANGWRASTRMLSATPSSARTFLINGQPPRPGEIFRNPDLAWSLQQIAARGRDGYYKGEIARRIVAATNALGGNWTEADLAEFSAEWVEPISTTYRGWTVYEIPPQGQGIAALVMLNLMEHFPIGEYGHNSARALHAMIEAKKLAYADMLRYVADQRFAKVPVAGMLSKEYAAERVKLIDPARANCAVEAGKPPAPGDDTIYLSVVDAEGNIVSLIQSNYSGFGSGIVPEGVGFMLHNRGALFTLDAMSPNVLAGRKRPLHTIIPAFMEKGDVRMGFGIMGGWNQSQAHAQFVSNVVDHGMNIQAAMEAARFTKQSFPGCDVDMERRIPEAVRAELTRLGHQLRLLGTYSGTVGGGQVAMRDSAAGVSFGASDPRKDGASIPQPPPNK